ncbi:MAG: hypothetical protein QN197_01485 [Armatimonadota bacterium]|nr:hypothetical protein [Armatimonadota bacterium]
MRPGRTRPEEITLFKSVGTAVLDVVVGAEALRRAASDAVGWEVELEGSGGES